MFCFPHRKALLFYCAWQTFCLHLFCCVIFFFCLLVCFLTWVFVCISFISTGFTSHARDLHLNAVDSLRLSAEFSWLSLSLTSFLSFNYKGSPTVSPHRLRESGNLFDSVTLLDLHEKKFPLLHCSIVFHEQNNLPFTLPWQSLGRFSYTEWLIECIPFQKLKGSLTASWSLFFALWCVGIVVDF